MAQDPSRRLDGWKAIADYLGRDVRTAQRWCDQRGMPVHRVPGGKSGTVFAEPHEIDAWLAGAARAAAHRHGPSTAHRSPENTPSMPPEAAPHSVGPGPARSRRRLAWIALAVVTLATAAVALVAVASRRGGDPPSRVEYDARSMSVLDAQRHLLWAAGLPPEAAGAAVSGGALGVRGFAWSVVDLHPEAGPEVLAFVDYFREGHPREQAAAQNVYCFSSTGALLWTFDPTYRLTFPDRAFAGPWLMRSWLASPAPDAQVWASFNHNVWWPSLVVRIDGLGKEQVKFVNSGHIEALSRLDRQGRRLLLAGGVNNEYRMAALAILDEDGPAASSPQAPGSSFACVGCPQARPLRYVLFPRSELNVAAGQPYNVVEIISAPGEVAPVELSAREVPDPRLRTVYTLDEDLLPVSVAMSDAYWERHDRLFRERQLDHASERCQELTRGMPVRIWEPSSGWREILVRSGTQLPAPGAQGGSRPSR